MLNAMQTRLANHVYAASTSFHSLYRKPFSSLLTIFIIAVSLMLPTLFWVLSNNIAAITKDWQQSGQINLYLKVPSTKEVAETLLKKISEDPNVALAQLISPEQGLKELQQQEGLDDIMKDLSSNPLPFVISMTPKLTLKDNNALEKFYTHLKSLPDIDQVSIDMEWISRLQSILHLIHKMTRSLLLILALAVVFIVATTLRLTLQKHLEEIRVLKLIGASDLYIIRPYLYSGLWYGLAGALLAILLVNFFIYQFASAMHQFTETYKINYTFLGLSVIEAYLVLIGSAVLGWFGARLAVKKQITLIEPYH